MNTFYSHVLFVIIAFLWTLAAHASSLWVWWRNESTSLDVTAYLRAAESSQNVKEQVKVKCHYQNCQNHFLFAARILADVWWYWHCKATLNQTALKLWGLRKTVWVEKFCRCTLFFAFLFLCQSCGLWTSLCHPMPGVMSMGLGRQRDAQMSWKHQSFASCFYLQPCVKFSINNCGILQRYTTINLVVSLYVHVTEESLSTFKSTLQLSSVKI